MSEEKPIDYTEERKKKDSFQIWKEKNPVPYYTVMPDGRKEPHLSPSRIKQYMDCPWAYAADRIMKLPKQMKSYLMMGNVLDEVVFEEFRHDFTQPIDDLVHLAYESLKQRMEEEPDLVKNDGTPYAPHEIIKECNSFRTWVRGFLEALQNGQDHEGHTVRLPQVTDTQTDAFWKLNIDGREVTLRGRPDIIHADGSVTDIKMASAAAPWIWTEGRIHSELQWIVYSQGLNSNKFRYLVLDKRVNKDRTAKKPTVRVITIDITPKDVEIFKEKLTTFLRNSDVLNNHKNGVFPPKPEYNGIATGFGWASKKQMLSQNNFCNKLCDFKEECWKQNFSANGTRNQTLDDYGYDLTIRD